MSFEASYGQAMTWLPPAQAANPDLQFDVAEKRELRNLMIGMANLALGKLLPEWQARTIYMAEETDGRVIRYPATQMERHHWRSADEYTILPLDNYNARLRLKTERPILAGGQQETNTFMVVDEPGPIPCLTRITQKRLIAPRRRPKHVADRVDFLNHTAYAALQQELAAIIATAYQPRQ